MPKKKDELAQDALTVGGTIEKSARSPFMVASKVTINIPTDPNDRHVYLMRGAKTENKKQLWGLSRPALDQIKDACGILIIESHQAPGVPVESNCITWQVKGQRDQIDGFRQIEVATYMLDLRVPRLFDPEAEDQVGGGGRYSELYAGYLDSLYDAAGKTLKFQWAFGAARVKRDVNIETAMEEKEEGWVVMQRRIAHVQAVREVRRRRPHIVRLAETGAIHALIRNMLGVKHAYTKEELEVGIVVLRAQANVDALDKLPEEMRTKLLMAQAMQAYGVDASYASVLLGSGDEQQAEPEVTDATEPIGEFFEGEEVDLAGVIDPDEDVIEGEVVKEEETSESEKAPAPKKDKDQRREDCLSIVEAVEGQADDFAPAENVQQALRREMTAREIGITGRQFPMKTGSIRLIFGLDQQLEEDEAPAETEGIKGTPEEIQI